MKEKIIALQRRGTFRVPIKDFWAFCSDTDRINRASGIPVTSFRPSPRLDGLPAMEARARYLGIPMRWTVLPFEWSAGRWFRVEYVFSRTPFLRTIRVGTRLRPLSADETEAEVFVDVVPTGPIGALAVHIVIGQYLLRQLMKTYRAIESNYQRGALNPFPKVGRIEVDDQQLTQALARLRESPVRSVLIDRLAAFLRQAEDREVLGIRPFVLADQWGEDRLEVLRLCLYATQAGLLDVSWEVLCPNCRISKASFGTLSALQSQAHCETCHIDYDVNFDEYVELRFNVNPAIREAYLLTYCVAEPLKMQHIVGQLRLRPGSSHELMLQLAAGRYRVRIPRWSSRATLAVTEGAPEAEATLRFTSDGIVPEALLLLPGECVLRLVNESDRELLVIVEQDAWGAQGASAALVTSLQEFRQLFSSEVLAPGMGVAVRNMTILFSDLKSSTQLYEDIGDPSAFALVRRHFEVVIDVIQRHRGALVKTIGDAVMAVFLSARDGVEAALEILAEIGRLNAQQSDQPPLHIKLGLHRGPCIAINANDTLDYFGTTVNLAARAQAESICDDVVITQALIDDPGVQQALAGERLKVERIERQPKGFSESYAFYRFSFVDPTQALPYAGAVAPADLPQGEDAGSSGASRAGAGPAPHPA
ncbi:MAG: hypothetical protein KatS3mg057_1803 [Herpetosiphonaceae bacterium]|nr:MAG: hypothetical protein KatS3mg057_1803 [Herpetosiphonaceae bacterium]